MNFALSMGKIVKEHINPSPLDCKKKAQMYSFNETGEPSLASGANSLSEADRFSELSLYILGRAWSKIQRH